MLLHTDIPTRAQLTKLLDRRDPNSVSIYVPTEPASDGAAERIAFKNLVREALRQLRDFDAPRADVTEIEEALEELESDDEFWAHQARTLAVFATAGSLVVFRLANRLAEMVEVSDRFHVKPLLRAQTFPQVAFVIALSQGAVRLVEIDADLPAREVRVPELPTDIASASGKASITDRSPSGRIQGSEGQKLRMRAYSRQIDQALRPVLAGTGLPLIIAGAEPLASIYRGANTYPHLTDAVIAGNPEGESDAQLAAHAREVLDGLYSAELAALHERYGQLAADGRGTSDTAEVARAATFGLIDTLLVDIDASVDGVVDETTGAITPGEPGVETYGVLDEIARRAWLADGTVLAVRREDIPGGGEVAAILRYAPFVP